MEKKFGLILAGGQSQRLFPSSDPKPLLEVDGRSLLEQAIERLKDFEVRVVANQEIANQIRSKFSLKGLPVPSFLIEPEGRDTAAAVGFGIREIQKESPDWVAVLSADQWMKDSKKFPPFLEEMEGEIKKFPDHLFLAGSSAKSKALSTHSRFGWIVPEAKRKLQKSRKVLRFVEKPSSLKLRNLRTRGGLINAGMFFGNYSTFLGAYEKFYPEVLKKTVHYSSLKRVPIDRAIFETYDKVRVMDLPVIWEDLGTWEEWYKHIGCGPGRKGILVDSVRILSSSDLDSEIFAFGVRDLAIIQSGKKFLVMPLSKTSALKDFLRKL